MLILFGAACVGILFEAVVPRTRRHRDPARPRAARAGRRAGHGDRGPQHPGRHHRRRGRGRRPDAVPVGLDPAARRRLAAADRRAVARAGRRVRVQAAITVGSQKDLKQAGGQPGATEVYPLTIFALGGMLLFVAANDLLTMFVALEVFSLPLYLLCALARRRRLLSQEAALKYFLLGSYASAFFLFGVALHLRLRRRGGPGVDPRRGGRPAAQRGAALRRPRAGLDRPALQERGGPVPRLDPGRLPGRPDPDHGADGGLHQGRGVRRPAARALRGVRRRPLGLPAGAGRHRGPDDADRRDPGGHPDRHEAAAGVLVDRERGLPAGGRPGAQQGGPVEHDVLPGRVRLLGAGGVRHRLAGPRRRRRGDPPVPLGRAWAARARCSPASSRSSCWPSPASR